MRFEFIILIERQLTFLIALLLGLSSSTGNKFCGLLFSSIFGFYL